MNVREWIVEVEECERKIAVVEEVAIRGYTKILESVPYSIILSLLLRIHFQS